jgi:hypothetical protein
VRQPARGSGNRNDLTRRSEGQGEREERSHSLFAQGPNATKLQQLRNRVDAVFTQQKPQPEGWGDCEAAQHVEGTAFGKTSEAATAEPAQSPMPEPVAETSQGVKGADALNQLTPLQQAALTAIGIWLLVIGHCGSTKLTTGGSAHLTTGEFEKQRLVQAGRLRYLAGPGGACVRAAA